MLTEYMEQAMGKARYELMDNGRFLATIPKCKGLWAEGKTLEVCREELWSTLEDWLLLGLQLGHHLPVIDGINLNWTWEGMVGYDTKAERARPRAQQVPPGRMRPILPRLIRARTLLRPRMGALRCVLSCVLPQPIKQ